MLDISSKKEDKSPVNPAELVTESEISGLNQVDTAKIAGIFSYAILVIFVAMSIFVFALATSKNTQLKNKQSNYDNLANQLRSDKDLNQVNELAQKFDSGLGKISSLLVKRASWSVFLDEIQKVTPPDVIYKNISVSEKTYITSINGDAGSYNSVTLLLAALRNSNKFSNIKLISVSQTEGSLQVSFNIELEVVEKNLTLK